MLCDLTNGDIPFKITDLLMKPSPPIRASSSSRCDILTIEPYVIVDFFESASDIVKYFYKRFTSKISIKFAFMIEDVFYILIEI